MQTYEIIVSGRAVHANSADTTLVRTSIGIDKIHVLFDNEEWTAFPVRVTFANGDTIISTSLTLTEIDAPEWAAEAECAIPWEVIQDLGGIRITFQGTDASGNHIITEASGEPLSVVEAGDVGSGTVPSPAPSVDEWNQAYANAMAAANLANGAAESADEAAALATEAAQQAAQAVPIATTDTVGKVKPDGTTVTIDNDGTIHSVGGYELPTMGVNTKGGAKVGNGLTVSNDTLSANVTGIKGNAEDSYRTGNVNLTPANLGAATQTDLAAAKQDISDLQDAVGDVDVSTDGSLQEQINDLGESVSPATINQSIPPATAARMPNNSTLWLNVPVPPGHTNVTVTSLPENFDLVALSSTSATGITVTVTSLQAAILSRCSLNLRFNITGGTTGNYITSATRYIGLSFT